MIKINDIEYSSFLEAIESAKSGDILVLTETTNEPFMLTKKIDITLDLNGNNIEFEHSKALDTTVYGYKANENYAISAVSVEKGAKLTVVGEGKIVNKKHSITAEVADDTNFCWHNTITNKGELILDGNFIVENEAKNIYCINNAGKLLTINDGVTVKQYEGTSAAIRNGLQAITNPNWKNADGEVLTPEEAEEKYGDTHYNWYYYMPNKNEMNPELVINGATIEGGRHSVNVESESLVIINSGTFTSADDAIKIEGKAIINGGTFNQGSKGAILLKEGFGDEFGALEFNDGVVNGDVLVVSDSEEKPASIKIAGGEINGTVTLSVNANVEITGGKFENPDDIKDFVSEDLIIDEDGNVIENKPTEEPSENPTEAPVSEELDLDELRTVTGIRKDILQKIIDDNPKHLLWHLFEGVKYEKLTDKIKKQIEAL